MANLSRQSAPTTRAADTIGSVQGGMNGGDFNVHQISSMLNEIVQNATGKTPPNVITTADFVAVAQTAINEVAWDKFIGAVSQMVSKTIVSVRPYTRQFWSLYVDNIKWGNHVRKLSFIDSDFDDSESWDLVDGQSVDMYKVKKDKVLQTNFYGQTTYHRSITWIQQQMNMAFAGPYEFYQYIAGKTMHLHNQLEQGHEGLARALVSNWIGAIVSMNETGRVIHLLTEYNAETGLALNDKTVYQGDNFKNFIGWLVAKVKTISDMLAERTGLYQTQIAGKTVNRHTPKNRQKMIIRNTNMYQMQSMALANTFHTEFSDMMTHQTTGYWQSPVERDSIKVKPVGIDTAGKPKVFEEVTVNKIFGIIFDVEAIGYTTVDYFSGVTPMNTRGRYTNQDFEYTDRYWNDFTEKGVVLLLD